MWDRVGNLGAFCSGEAGPGTVFDRLGFPEPLPGVGMEARTEPEARTETDAPSSIKVSMARSKAPADLIVLCVAADALLERGVPVKVVANEREEIVESNDAAEVWREGPVRCLSSDDAEVGNLTLFVPSLNEDL